MCKLESLRQQKDFERKYVRQLVDRFHSDGVDENIVPPDDTVRDTLEKLILLLKAENPD
jgi:superfamily I DNA and/or RNA helicase